MHYYEVAPNQIVRTDRAFFTYASKESLPVGKIVIIEVGKKSLIGIVLRETQKPAYDTKAITATVEDNPLPVPLVKLMMWLSQYYATPLATVIQSILPRGLQKKRREQKNHPLPILRDRTKKVFTSEQDAAIKTLEEMKSGTALLHGITGSGKTTVYIELARHTIAYNKSVVILVPEIALTSQLVDEFSHHFQDIILVHSRQTEAQRHLIWQEVLITQKPHIVIGPRSALFSPLAHIGLIIIDEAHEPSFKQEQSPRYSALRAASVLAKHHQAKVILGSATPSIADYYVAKASNRPIITMEKRARLDAIAPNITLVDMKKRESFKRHRFLSDPLIRHIEATLASKKQVLLFHNRRGTASTTLCENCGWSAICPRCFIPFTLHADQHLLRCHICNTSVNVPTSCPECNSTDILHKGIGTKLIESSLQALFPKQKIARFDGDSEIIDSVEKKYGDLYEGKIDIIIGTQVVAKGLDLPHLRTVGVIQADAGLSLPDYSSSERTFQLLAQVVGRVGRSKHPTNVIIQSYQPNHQAIVDGLNQNYNHFYESILSERRKSHFPPFCYLLKLTCIYKTESATIKNAQQLAVTLRKEMKDVEILGPTPAFYERQHDTYRWQLVLKSSKRSRLIDVLHYLPPTHWQFELDPTSLL